MAQSGSRERREAGRLGLELSGGLGYLGEAGASGRGEGALLGRFSGVGLWEWSINEGPAEGASVYGSSVASNRDLKEKRAE